MSFSNIFSKPEAGPSRGASLVLRCSNLSPSHYQNAAQAIEKMGLKGFMEMSKDGKITIDIEGPHEVVEKLLNLAEKTLFGCACETELVWKPFANKYSRFIAHPYFAAQPPTSDKKPPQL